MNDYEVARKVEQIRVMEKLLDEIRRDAARLDQMIHDGQLERRLLCLEPPKSTGTAREGGKGKTPCRS